MANPYVAVIGNICAGKSTFVNRFSASHREWCGLPEVLSESQRSSLCGPDSFYRYASFFADFYIERHRLVAGDPRPADPGELPGVQQPVPQGVL